MVMPYQCSRSPSQWRLCQSESSASKDGMVVGPFEMGRTARAWGSDGTRRGSLRAATAVRSLASLAGEGWGEGEFQRVSLLKVPLTRRASRVDLSPQAG